MCDFSVLDIKRFYEQCAIQITYKTKGTKIYCLKKNRWNKIKKNKDSSKKNCMEESFPHKKTKKTGYNF